MIGLDLSGCVNKKRVKRGINSILLPVMFRIYSYTVFCIFSYSLYFFLIFNLAKLLNFIFIEVTWKLGYLRWLNFAQERHTSCLHAKWLIVSGCGDKLFPKNCELSPVIMITRFQKDTFQVKKSPIFEDTNN